MSSGWFGALRDPKHANGADSSRSRIGVVDEGFWRAWLATGARRAPIDRRRARGAEAQLKKILVGGPSGAVDFSSAMARQAIDEALYELPSKHKHVVKLAYFGGLTNREIAQQLGLSVSGVRRVLRESLAIVGAHFERGRAKGRRAIQDLLMLFFWRRLGDGMQRPHGPALDQVLQTGIAAVVTAAAVAILVTHHAPSPIAPAHRTPHAAAVGSPGSHLFQAHKATLAAAADPMTRNLTVADAKNPSAAVAALPLKVPVPAISVPVPSLALPKLRAPAIPQLPLGA
jgi:sigma-70-like protein